MFKKVLWGFLICLFFSVSNCLAFDSTSWDFGQLKQGQVVSHIFVLKNDSAEILRIKSFLPSCGCTKAKIGKDALNPGESVNLEVTFNSHGYSGDVQQFVYLNTDSPADPVTKFTVKANVAK